VSVLAYLRFSLAPGADLEAFPRDLRAVRELAAERPGDRRTEVGRDPDGGPGAGERR